MKIRKMRISTAKTEVMAFSRRPIDCTIHVKGTQLKQVDEFKYLGSIFAENGRQDREIDRRINLASGVSRELWKTMISNPHLSRQSKLAVFRSVFKPTLTFGAQTWILDTSTRSRLEATEMRFLRKILGVTRLDMIRNTHIRETLSVDSLLLDVERSQMRWLGQVLTMPQDRMALRILEAEPQERRPPGRPRTRWMDQLKKICQRAGVEADSIKQEAEDRTGWRRLIADLRDPD